MGWIFVDRAHPGMSDDKINFESFTHEQDRFCKPKGYESDHFHITREHEVGALQASRIDRSQVPRRR